MAVIELDKRDTDFKQPALYRVAADGRKLVKQQAAKDWAQIGFSHRLSAHFINALRQNVGKWPFFWKIQ